MKRSTFLGLCVSALPGLKLISAEAGNKVPRPAPPLQYELPNGSMESLSKYRGKVVCVQFLYTTCPHCQVASQLLSKLNTEYGPRGFQPIGVAFNPMAKVVVADYVRDYKVNFPVGSTQREPAMQFLGYSPDERISVPQIVFIDRKGIIRQQSRQNNDGETAAEPNLRQMIELLLKEPAPGSASRKGVKKAAR
ncbi:MAG TPA: TlpA disulfide reductase family protein [Bryobacteraceae bacterium]|nr:TlpA disulfide reductase family protein [Bryobacteraceae bacterium]